MAQDRNFSLKDMLFNKEKLEKISQEIKTVSSDFKDKAFVKTTLEKFPQLELKERIVWIRENLYKYLPKNYKKAVHILVQSLPEKLDPTLTDNDFGDFIYAPYADYVAHYGCSANHLTFSLNALQEMTMRFSVEDAIRYFINAFPKETLTILKTWAEHKNYHVRRLVSEGTRPKLPWAKKISIDIKTPIPLLEKLFYDNTRYVTRSVANHINDISKIDSDLAIKTLERWRNSKKQKEAEMNFIIRHSLRSLVKQGHPKTLHLLGFSSKPNIKVSGIKTKNNKVKIGEAFEFEFVIEAFKNEKLMVDYIMYFQNKAGEMKNKKVYKIKQFHISKGESQSVIKNHPLRRMTTRTLYPGLHKIEIQVNGNIMASAEFKLVD